MQNEYLLGKDGQREKGREQKGKEEKKEGKWKKEGRKETAYVCMKTHKYAHTRVS